MASINGTNVAAPIRPFDTNDTFATAYGNEIKGGHHSVDNKMAMLAIPPDRREVGMTVTTVDDGKMYRLVKNSTELRTEATDWVDQMNSDSITFKDGVTTLTTKLDEIDSNSANKWVIIIAHNADKTGPNNVEIRVPFKANVVSATASAPVDAMLSSGIALNVEAFNLKTKKWETLVPLKLTAKSDNNEEETILNAPVEIPAGTKVRVNIITPQPTINVVEVNVALVALPENKNNQGE